MRRLQTIDPVLDKLERVKQTGENAWTALCPAHEDRNASLSIKHTADDKLLFHCHANCPTENVVAALGMTMADLMPPNDDPPAKPRIAVAYDYRDESGELLYQALRMEPKDFRQRKPDGKGGWVWNLNGTQRVLYRLPELRDAPLSAIVFIAEGEKDVDKLRAWGLLATTNVGGAGKWKPEYNEHFADRLVCILPDNDQPGIDHANKVAAALKPVAKKLKVVLLPNLPPKGDVSDWIAAGGTKEELLQLVAPAPEWTEELKLAPTKPKLTTLAEQAIRYIEYARSGGGRVITTGLPDVDYAIGGGVEESEIVVIGARPNHGKSMVALQCVHHWTANGMPSLFISIEMASLQLGKRTILYASDEPQEHWNSRLKVLENAVDEYAKNRAPCYVVEEVTKLHDAIELIERCVVEHGVKCVAVDYAQLLQVQGKSVYEKGIAISTELKRITKKHKLVMVALCQLNRQVETRPKFIPKPSDLKDSGQWEQDADVILLLVWPHRIDAKSPAAEYQIFVAKNRNREIRKGGVKVKFMPSRQMLVTGTPEYQEWDGSE